MKKVGVLVIFSLLIITGTGFADGKWTMSTGATFQSRLFDLTDKGLEAEMPDDFEEGAQSYLDINVIDLRKQLNETWSLGYSFGLAFVDDSELYFEKGNFKDDNQRRYDTHELRLRGDYGKHMLFGQEWAANGYFALRNYRENDMKNDEGEFALEGFKSNRFYAGASADTSLSEKLSLNISYDFQYREYDNTEDPEEYKQFRHFLSETLSYKFCDSLNISWYNLLYFKHYQKSKHNNVAEWDTALTLTYSKDLGKGIGLSVPVGFWTERTFYKESPGHTPENEQAEAFAKAELSYSEDINKSISMDLNCTGGYIHGFNTQDNDFDEFYSGWEYSAGINFNIKL